VAAHHKVPYAAKLSARPLSSKLKRKSSSRPLLGLPLLLLLHLPGKKEPKIFKVSIMSLIRCKIAGYIPLINYLLIYLPGFIWELRQP
jgi:hypothetical protein